MRKVERSGGGCCKASARGVRKIAATSNWAAPKPQRAGPSAEQKDLGEGSNHVVRGKRLGLRSPSRSLQRPLNRKLGRQRRKLPRVSKPPPPKPRPLNWWSAPNI
jgi:hypothetical protein